MLAASHKNIDDFQGVILLLLVEICNLRQCFHRDSVDYNAAFSIFSVDHVQHLAQIATAAAHENAVRRGHILDIFQRLTSHDFEVFHAKERFILAQQLHRYRIALKGPHPALLGN